jgi:VCBS repeat-containing protein
MFATARRELGSRGAAEAGRAAAVSTRTASAEAAAPSLSEVVQYTLFHRSANANPVQSPGQSPTGVVTGNLNAVTTNGATMTYTLDQAPASGSVVIGQDGSYTYSPEKSLVRTGGSDTFRVTIDNGRDYRLTGIGGAIQGIVSVLAQLIGLRQPDTVSVTVPVGIFANHAPVVVSSNVGVPNVTTGVVTGTVSATDSDGQPLTYEGSTTTAKGSVVVTSNGSFTYTPTATARHAAAKNDATAADQDDTFTVTVADGYGGTAIARVHVAISPTNSAPVAGFTRVETPNASTGAVTGTVSATDANGDALTYSGSAATAKGSVIVTSNGSFTYTPTPAARKQATADTTDTFAVTIDDGYGGAAKLIVTVPVEPSITAGPFEFVLNKLKAGQSVSLLSLGDSTVAGVGDETYSGGWPTVLAKALGSYYNVTVKNAFGTVISTGTGTGAPINSYNAGIGLATLANQFGWWPGNATKYGATADVIIIGQGFNDLLLGGLNPTTFTASYRDFIAQIQADCPGVPIIITDANMSTGNIQTLFAAGFNALFTSFIGTTAPLSPALIASANTPGVWCLDTWQAYGNTYQPSLMADGLHPNAAGYTVQANWMLEQLAPDVVGW